MDSERERLRRARRVVVKIGSRLLRESPVGRAAAIADEVAALKATRGLEVVVVTSGAIALGLRALRLAERPRELPRLQATAAVGQGLLMQHWERAFGAHDLAVGQVLLTHDDVAARGRFLSARHAISAMFELGAVPVINENDTVAVDEIKFGDNDRLAALVTSLVSADALVLLTDVEGLLDGQARRVSLVRDPDAEALPLAGGAAAGGVGTGGMASKVHAAKVAGKGGTPTVVAPGRRTDVLRAVLGGDDVGTLFVPDGNVLAGRKHWIAFGSRPAGALVVDDGARVALVEKNRSLLPTGVTEVRGRFEIGDVVSVMDPQKQEFARGLARYAAEEVARIRGRRSADIEAILGYKYLDEVIHRDDLVVL